MSFKRLALLLASIVITLAGSARAEDIDSRIQAALDSAGSNRPELEKALAHFADSGDQQKNDAVRFLVANMSGHSYVTYRFVDTIGQTVEFAPLIYPNYDSLTAAFGALEDERGVLDYERDTKLADLETITAEYLIRQVDLAFKAWREKPWARSLPFETFCRYVLPYRGSNEPLEDWRQYFLNKYEDLSAEMSDSTDPIEAAALINQDVRSWFGFDPRYYYHPTDQGLSEMMSSGLGRCEDMTNVTIYALRANGIAVTSDYTPYWANTGNNHAWNAVITPDGRAIPFMGAEADPGKYHLANKVAKVYRKMFDEQPGNLVFQQHKQDSLPRWLAGKNYIDVTPAYTEVSDIPVQFSKAVPDSVDIAYLCVFNSGEWQPIHWGRIEGNTATFTDMGRDIAYLPVLYLNGESVPWDDPFILSSDGSVVIIEADTDATAAIQLISTTARKLEASTDSVRKSFLAPGVEYELYYWADGWQLVDMKTAGEGPLELDHVPAGGLYWLVAKDSDREERIFTIDSGRQVWW